MRWITEISFNNYRAFKNSFNPIKIPENHHLLIYGENGSGKSSIYNAIKDFFNSSADPSKKFVLNLFSQLTQNNTGEIELKVSDIDVNKNITSVNTYVFCEPYSKSTHRVPEIQLPNKIKGFLDYKRVLETYFLKGKLGQNPNLFSLLVEDLLADHTISSSSGGVATVSLINEWNRLKNPIYNLDRRSKAHKTAVAELSAFESILKQLLTQVFSESKKIITNYFDPKLDVNVSVSNMVMDYISWEVKQEIFLEVSYAGKNITSYDTILNEARLSAIGITIFLASLKTYPVDATDLRVVFLDDVFIGLDTNNRIPLLKILKDEFIKQDYQIFIATYDRQWFETARYWLQIEKCPVTCLELFSGNDGGPLSPDIPVMISPSLINIEKAKAYFDARDYPAAANYLRKTCEEELRRILPSHMKLCIYRQTDEIKLINNLETLVSNFDNYLKKNNLDITPFIHFRTYKKILLNPLSHDDLLAPHYRREIEEGIRLVEELKNIKTKEIVFAKDNILKPMKLGMRDLSTGNMYIYKIIVLENLQIIQQNMAQIKLSAIECEVTESTTRKFATLQQAFDQLWIERGNITPTNNFAFYNHIKISNRKKLINLMSF